jgi:hypothetical protein
MTEIFALLHCDSVPSKLELLQWCMFTGPKQGDIVMYLCNLCRGKSFSRALFVGVGANVFFRAAIVNSGHFGYRTALCYWFEQTQKMYNLGKGNDSPPPFPPIRCNISFMGMKCSHTSVEKIIRNISVVEYAAVSWLRVYLLFVFVQKQVSIADVHI